jgi:hypothetical protein
LPRKAFSKGQNGFGFDVLGQISGKSISEIILRQFLNFGLSVIMKYSWRLACHDETTREATDRAHLFPIPGFGGLPRKAFSK